MTDATQSTPGASAANEPTADQENPAVARCLSVWTIAYKANNKNSYEASKAAAEAYRNAMPRLSGYENICNFIACVAHGILIGAIDRKDSTKLLYAAQVALSSVHRPAPPKSAAA
ncbi:MAG: hypothetical protein ABSC77_09410 [Terracidiphilus sp.]|jgi:hypothetical protein